MLSLTVILQETVMKYLTKHIEKSKPLGTTGKILTENDEKCILGVSHSTCAENDDYYEKGDFCTSMENVKAGEPGFDKAKVVNEEPERFEVKETVYNPLDIRMVFGEAIDDFYNYSENGGPSLYEEKLVLLMEGYLKNNRRLSWAKKLNRLEIRKYVFSNIAKLSTPPVKQTSNDPAPMENSSSELMLPLKSENLYEKEICSRLAKLAIQYPPVQHSAFMKNSNSKNKEKKKFRGVRKFFSSLFCRRKKYNKD